MNTTRKTPRPNVYMAAGILRESIPAVRSFIVKEPINKPTVCYILCGVMLGCAATANLSVSGIVQAPIKYNGAMGMMFEAFPAFFIGLYLSRYTNLTQ